MERDEFISKLGVGILAVCTGCMAACSSNKNNDPAPDPPAGSGKIFSVDLNTEITAVGNAKVSNGIILARIAAGNAVTAFTAVQVACTHEGTSINYSAADSKFICPLHGSQFSQTGQVLMGPAVIALKKYTVSITGTTLTVSA